MILGLETCPASFIPPSRHASADAGAIARLISQCRNPAIYRRDARVAKSRESESGEGPSDLDMFRGITAVADNGGRFLERLYALNWAAVVFSSDNGCFPWRTRLVCQAHRPRRVDPHPDAAPPHAWRESRADRGLYGSQHCHCGRLPQASRRRSDADVVGGNVIWEMLGPGGVRPCSEISRNVPTRDAWAG